MTDEDATRSEAEAYESARYDAMTPAERIAEAIALSRLATTLAAEAADRKQ
jgi:hypothetical protein